MNDRIKELMMQAGTDTSGKWMSIDNAEKLAELIIEDCREVITTVYRESPLELVGPLLTADEKIMEQFYGKPT